MARRRARAGSKCADHLMRDTLLAHFSDVHTHVDQPAVWRREVRIHPQ